MFLVHLLIKEKLFLWPPGFSIVGVSFKWWQELKSTASCTSKQHSTSKDTHRTLFSQWILAFFPGYRACLLHPLSSCCNYSQCAQPICCLCPDSVQYFSVSESDVLLVWLTACNLVFNFCLPWASSCCHTAIDEPNCTTCGARCWKCHDTKACDKGTICSLPYN